MLNAQREKLAVACIAILAVSAAVAVFFTQKPKRKPSKRRSTIEMEPVEQQPVTPLQVSANSSQDINTTIPNNLNVDGIYTF